MSPTFKRPFHTFLAKVNTSPTRPFSITSPHSIFFFTKLSFSEIALVIYCFLIVYLHEDRSLVFFPVVSQAQKTAPAHGSVPRALSERTDTEALAGFWKSWEYKKALQITASVLLYSESLQRYRSTATTSNTGISLACEDHSNNSPSPKHMF